MQRLTDLKISRLLLIACFLSYAITTAAKMCVPTVISAMVNEGFMTKSQSGLLSGIFYLFYGVGQLFLGKYFNDHPPFIGIKLALLGSGACCFFMSLTDNFYLLLLFWSLCAVFNACFFPALMKIISFMLCGKDSAWASKYMLIAQQGGTILCLIAGSVIIEYASWVNLYYFAAAISALTFVYWCYAEYKAKRCLPEAVTSDAVQHPVAAEETAEKHPIMSYVGTGIFCIFAVSMFNALVTGVKTWAPTIIMETYHTSPGFSVLLNIVIVGSNILFLLALGKRPWGRELKSVIMISLFSLPFVVLMNFPGLLNEYVFTLLIGLLTSVAVYITNVAVIQVPYYFDKYNDVARISGISNMAASFGVLLGNYLYGVLADLFGWQVILLLCTAFVVVNILLSAIADKGFQKLARGRYSH